MVRTAAISSNEGSALIAGNNGLMDMDSFTPPASPMSASSLTSPISVNSPASPVLVSSPASPMKGHAPDLQSPFLAGIVGDPVATEMDISPPPANNQASLPPPAKAAVDPAAAISLEDGSITLGVPPVAPAMSGPDGAIAERVATALNLEPTATLTPPLFSAGPATATATSWSASSLAYSTDSLDGDGHGLDGATWLTEALPGDMAAPISPSAPARRPRPAETLRPLDAAPPRPRRRPENRDKAEPLSWRLARRRQPPATIRRPPRI